MTTREREAVLGVCLMAAFADGAKSEAERAELRRMVDGFKDPEVNLAGMYQDVLLRRRTLSELAAPLTTVELRRLAYEMAVCVCDADDALTAAESGFLTALRGELGLEDEQVAAFRAEAAAMVTALPGAGPPPVPADAGLDRTILNYAVLNGALELLPETLATLAIVPLQMKMVYEIGRQHGVTLDRGHLREFLATAGVGLTAQVMEGYARKLLGGLVGKVAGGLGRGVARQVAGSALSFATTYALGQAAKRYYAGGRRLSAVELKDLFGSLTREARSLHEHYADDIRRRAAEVNVRQLLPMLRG